MNTTNAENGIPTAIFVYVDYTPELGQQWKDSVEIKDLVLIIKAKVL